MSISRAKGLTEPISAICQYPYGYAGYIKWNLLVRLVFGLQPFGNDVPEKPAIILGRAIDKSAGYSETPYINQTTWCPLRRPQSKFEWL